MAKRFRAAAAIVLLLVFLFCLVQAVPVGVPQSLTVSAVRPDLVARLATTKPGDAGGARAREGLTCEICTRLTELVQRLFDEKKCEDDIVDIARSFCDEFHIEDRNVCAAIVQEFKHEVLFVVSKIALSPKQICGFLLGDGCGDDFFPFDQNWNVTIPEGKPPINPVPPPKDGSPTNRILLLTDMHYDKNYTEGLSNDCGEPLCCRIPNPPGNGSTAAGRWGDYNCDVPMRTLENLLEFIADNLLDEFDWVYWTGDLPAHNVWHQSRADQLDVLSQMCQLMNKYLPGKVIFPSLGNHESSPVNSFPPPFITGEYSNSWLLDAAADEWSVWLDQLEGWEKANKTIRRGGFYNVKVRDGLRVISLQTNFANNGNYWLLINASDPAGQLQWLVEQLLAAEASGDKVHIISHLFPASMIHTWARNFRDIVNRFESTIVGQFYGHTHMDLLSIYFDTKNTSRATNVAYAGPAVTPNPGTNLGFRIYTIDGTYDGSTRAIQDHKNWYMNLTEANLTQKPRWQLEYTCKEAYGLTSLQPQDWAQLVDKFWTDDALFQKYLNFFYQMHPPPCDKTCRAAMICAIYQFSNRADPACQSRLPEGLSAAAVRQYQARFNVC